MKLKASVAYIYMFYFPPMLPVFSSLSLDSWQPVKRRYNSQTAVYLKLVWASAHRMASSHPETHLLSNFFCWYWWKGERMTHWKVCGFSVLGRCCVFLGVWDGAIGFLTSRISLRPKKLMFSKVSVWIYLQVLARFSTSFWESVSISSITLCPHWW